MIAHQKILRVFRLIAFLTRSRLTLSGLSSRMDVSERTVYRYILLLREIGFKVHVRNSRYLIDKDEMPDFVPRVFEKA